MMAFTFRHGSTLLGHASFSTKGFFMKTPDYMIPYEIIMFLPSNNSSTDYPSLFGAYIIS